MNCLNLTVDTVMNEANNENLEYYFEEKGKRIGPVSNDFIVQALAEGKLDLDTLIWSGGFNSTWRKLSDCNFSSNLPPPLPKKSISKIYIWLLVVSPIIIGIILFLFDYSSIFSMFIYFFTYSILILLDANAIKQSGRNTKNISTKIWLLFIPIYFLQRYRILKEGAYLFFIWFVALMLSIFIQSPDTFGKPIYFGAGVPSCGSQFEKKEVQKIFGDVPVMKRRTIDALSIQNIQKLNETENQKICQATISADNGKTYTVNYTVSKKDDKYYTYVQIINPN